MDRAPAEHQRFHGSDATPAKRVENEVARLRERLDVGLDYVPRPFREIGVTAPMTLRRLLPRRDRLRDRLDICPARDAADPKEKSGSTAFLAGGNIRSIGTSSASANVATVAAVGSAP